MGERSSWQSAWLIGALVTAAACGPGVRPPPSTHGVGESCGTNADCTSGMCVTMSGTYSYCTAPCTSDAECGTVGHLVCGVAAGGAHQCVPACPNVAARYVCVGGVSTACDVAADPTQCMTCGCDASLRCDPGVGCVPKSDVDGPCRVNDDCRTGNCSQYSHVCRVPIGQPCTMSNCDICIAGPSGYSHCSAECERDSDCNGDVCLGSVDTGYFWCRPRCSSLSDPSCPGTCRYSTGSTPMAFCECNGTGCGPVTGTMRGVGDACNSNANCASGTCLARQICDSSRFYCMGYGYCTATCTSDATCGTGGRCVDVPCVGGATTGCGHVCLPGCTSYSDCGPRATPERYRCDMLADVDGTAAQVCDPRLADGAGVCAFASDCVSGNCVTSHCAPSTGVPNGGSCAVAGDCISHNCVSGHCRGSALLGDPCSMPADCATGMCCTSGPHVGTCASTC